jgi:hypothetical protein
MKHNTQYFENSFHMTKFKYKRLKRRKETHKLNQKFLTHLKKDRLKVVKVEEQIQK